MRRSRLLEKLRNNSVDALLVSKEANVSYLCDYPCRDSYLLVHPKETIFITDFRYTEEAKKNIPGVTVFQYDNLFKDTAALARKLKVRKLGFEAKDLNFAEYSKIKSYLDPKAKLKDTFNIVETLRQIKGDQEINLIRQAIKITAQTFEFIRKFLKPGVKELEIAAEIERFIRYQGAKMSAFNILIASGPNSSLPHALISSRKIRPGEPILIDIGVDINGYKSDLTRVFFLDKIPTIQRRIYGIIQEAQGLAIAAVKPGIIIADIDSAGRKHIEEQGFGRYFGHSLGHGIGLEVHEEPSISSKNKAQHLEEGMVFTIEPGIYLPGKFGIRLEDIVLVTKKGAEVLSGAVNKSI
ncbi:MAG TPA: Xaa-Pro peptidase family protein [Candidatus Omnitrophota bacterium]|nr:Xaa-Pro peptidase family protein [Candidatus Omnitrophota bacterium]